MWKYLLLCLILGIASCSGAKSSSDKSGEEKTDNEEILSPDLSGQWDIENIVENDSSYVRPSEIESVVTAYIEFNEDDTFGIMTNCNHLGGQYEQKDYSIRFSDISTTEVACDNMEVEEILKKVLPMVRTVDPVSDSVTRLNTTKPGCYIVLRKSYLNVK